MLAVLETPYVPLTGQDPAVAPYERTVRSTIIRRARIRRAPLARAASLREHRLLFPGCKLERHRDCFTTLTDNFINSTRLQK